MDINVDISVIVPIYNAEKTIERTIRALAVQTYAQFEVILIDNGSTDKTAKICLECQKKDNRFQYIYTDKKGVSNARNIGLERAKGRYICFCDSDDIPAKNMLQVLKKDIEEYQCDCVMCNYYTERDQCESIFPFDVESVFEDRRISDVLIPAMFSCTSNVAAIWGTVWRCIFKKNLIQELDLKFDTRLTFAEDLCFVIAYLGVAKRVYLEKEVLYYYCMTDGSAMLSFNRYKPQLAEERIYLIKKLSSILEDYGIYKQIQSDVVTVFQEYILECIGNAAVKSNKHNLMDSFNAIRGIITNNCVEEVFRKIYTKDKRHKVVFKMIQLKMSILLTLYYSLRKG